MRIVRACGVVSPRLLLHLVPIAFVLSSGSAAEIRLQKVVSAENPICVAQVPEPMGPLFVLQRNGRLIACGADGASPHTVCEIASLAWDHDRNSETSEISRKVHQEVETGAFSICLRPDFTVEGGIAYLRYVDPNGPPGRWGGKVCIDVIFSAQIRLDRETFHYRLDHDSVREVYRVPQAANSHNGGWMGFDPIAAGSRNNPRFLLCSSYGDDESLGWPNPSDQTRRPQLLDNPYGKILRFDVTPETKAPDKPYTIPDDNPFVKTSNALPEIHHLGLRNPWRCAFDRKTGDLWIADVGDHFEEVNMGPAGKGGINFGWPLFDGPSPFRIPKEGDAAKWDAVRETWALAEGTTHQTPVWQYHNDGAQSITGGVLYRGNALSSLRGCYLHSDYFADRLRWIDAGGSPTNQSGPLWDLRNTASYSEGFDGEIFTCSFASGGVFKIIEK